MLKLGNKITLPHRAIKDLGLRISGPFHSMEMTVKHSLTRHMICLVSGSGKSVSDSVVLFQKSRPGYWNTLTVVQLCGRNKGMPPTSQEIDKNNSIYCHNVPGERASIKLAYQSTDSCSLTNKQLLTPQDLLEKIENAISSNHRHVSISTTEKMEEAYDVTKASCIQVSYD